MRTPTLQRRLRPGTTVHILDRQRAQLVSGAIDRVTELADRTEVVLTRYVGLNTHLGFLFGNRQGESSEYVVTFHPDGNYDVTDRYAHHKEMADKHIEAQGGMLPWRAKSFPRKYQTYLAAAKRLR